MFLTPFFIRKGVDMNMDEKIKSAGIYIRVSTQAPKSEKKY